MRQYSGQLRSDRMNSEASREEYAEAIFDINKNPLARRYSDGSKIVCDEVSSQRKEKRKRKDAETRKRD